MRARVEVRGRAAFAEVAETLGVNTDAVLAVHGSPFGVGVLYSPSVIEPTRIHAVTLARQLDGTLAAVSASVEVHGLWDEIERRLQG